MSMIRRLLRKPNSMWRKLVISTLLCTLAYTGTYMFTAEGETTLPKFVMMRLEDVGPGGQYDSLEGLGKLRAVLDYMHDHRIPVQLAVIPRWVNVSGDGTRYDRSLDDASDPLTNAFARVLRSEAGRGAVIGMHGYTHQVGDVKRADGFQESGIGNEFNVEGSAETDTAAFASERMREGLRIFQAAGLVPRFWEAPHYHTTAAQDAVFRTYFGLLYQANVHAKRNAPVAQYAMERIPGRGLGAVYVPTPLSYIPYNKDENIIVDKLGKTESVSSFFYHPFLEFKHLIPVMDGEGVPLLRDGIPEFRYPDKDKTPLQKLDAKVKAKGYAFYSIHDYIPFSPSVSLPYGTGSGELVRIGDADGDGLADLMSWQTNTGIVSVTSDPFAGRRGEAVPEPKRWAKIDYAQGSTCALRDTNGDGKQELWVLRAGGSGRLEQYEADGGSFVLRRTWALKLPALAELLVVPQKGGGVLVAGATSDGASLQGAIVRDRTAKPLKPYKFKTATPKQLMVSADAGGTASPDAPGLVLARKDASTLVVFTPDQALSEWRMQKTDLPIPAERGELSLGDYNGDGREDVLRYDAERQIYAVYLQTPEHEYRLLSTFGPWGGVGGKLVMSDLDGNGKCDIALIERNEPFLDTALSYETTVSPVFAAP